MANEDVKIVKYLVSMYVAVDLEHREVLSARVDTESIHGFEKGRMTDAYHVAGEFIRKNKAEFTAMVEVT